MPETRSHDPFRRRRRSGNTDRREFYVSAKGQSARESPKRWGAASPSFPRDNHTWGRALRELAVRTRRTGWLSFSSECVTADSPQMMD